MSAQPQKVVFDLAAQGFTSPQATTLLTTMPNLQGSAALSDMQLAPFSVYIGEVTKPAGTGSSK